MAGIRIRNKEFNLPTFSNAETPEKSQIQVPRMGIGRHTPYLGRSRGLNPHATEKRVCPDCDTLDVF